MYYWLSRKPSTETRFSLGLRQLLTHFVFCSFISILYNLQITACPSVISNVVQLISCKVFATKVDNGIGFIRDQRDFALESFSATEIYRRS